MTPTFSPLRTARRQALDIRPKIASSSSDRSTSNVRVGSLANPQAVEIFGPQPAVLELDVRAAERPEREGDQGGRGVAPARALLEVEPHRLGRPARERAAEDAKPMRRMISPVK